MKKEFELELTNLDVLVKELKDIIKNEDTII
ncbi:MAG: tRNA (adenosine(37)-N6)-threonylcarbamoyltransferase complex ATPase subunit type 1 TsaE, partial [Arcobacter sp.]|nr:tRNA (adenosine(37)-N6)-threonylcarbamoyltransferase complex ATPase subunit type 1 TsaE [Arcobacter sp.]